MIGAGVDFAFVARTDDLARTILVVLKKRDAAVDALFLVSLGRIERSIRPSGIARDLSVVGRRVRISGRRALPRSLF
jgi:hypothetical protein